MSRHLPVAGSLAEPLHAVGARFDTPDALIAAVRSIRAAGYNAVDCYTPYPIHGLAEELKAPKSLISFLVLGGAVTAIALALTMQLVPSSLIYPLVVGGKPVNFSGLPQYVPITVALTLMLGALAAVKGMILLGGMPRLNHPMLAWDLFAKDASRGFFLAVSARDPYFTVEKVTELLEASGAGDITAIHLEPSDDE
jgi:hypothetical protein